MFFKKSFIYQALRDFMEIYGFMKSGQYITMPSFIYDHIFFIYKLFGEPFGFRTNFTQIAL